MSRDTDLVSASRSLVTQEPAVLSADARAAKLGVRPVAAAVGGRTNPSLPASSARPEGNGSLAAVDHIKALIADVAADVQFSEQGVKSLVSQQSQIWLRLQALEDEVQRLKGQLQTFQSMTEISKAQCAMFSEALAVKETQVVQLMATVDHIARDRDALADRFARERADSVEAQKALVDELEAAKADRLLAQGALTIARASREKLLRRIVDLTSEK